MDIAEFNKRIAATSEDKSIPLGLLHGKTGLSIYFYRLAREENKEEWGKIAERLLDEVFEQIGMAKSIDLENGLAGIGLGISYLLRNGYVNGDENEILRDIDDEIFKQACVSDSPINDNPSLLTQILLYICARKQALRGEQEYLMRELAIQIVNTLHASVGKILSDEAISFRLDSDLPLLLFALGKAYETGIYNYKIERIMREIIPFILSKYGCNDSRKLHLLWGISKINEYIRDRRLTEYGNLLASHIDMDNLIGEFRSKNMFLKKGLAGVCLLMLTADDNMKSLLEVDKFFAIAKEKIENLFQWETSDKEGHLVANLGLSGYCGLMSVHNAITQSV